MVGGGTPSLEALASVFDSEKKKGNLLDKKSYKRRTILHITDGMPNDGDSVIKSLNKVLNKEGVFTPAIAIGVDEASMRTMYQQVEIIPRSGEKGSIRKAVKNIIKKIRFF